MAEILLVYPKAGHDIRGVSVNAPLSLLSLAGVLEREYSVAILDQRVSDDFWKELDRALRRRPLLVGITSMTGTQIYHALEISRHIKKYSNIPVVWGGMHPTIYPKQTVAETGIDFVVSGEGEEALLSLAGVIRSGSPAYESVPALAWKRGEQIFVNPPAPPLELNRLPKIPWELVPVEEYIAPTQFLYPGINRLLPVQASRGCPFKCTFCSESVLTRKFRLMDPAKVVRECLEMTAKYQLDHIVFFDEEFFVNKIWAMQIAEEINGRFSWAVQSRANDLLRLDLKKLERCGLHVVSPGLESGSNRLLKYMRKMETVQEYKEANARLAQTKIFAQYNFIIGFPTESEDELNATIDLVLYLLETNKNANVNQLSPLTPLPGTEMLKQAVQDFGFTEPETLEGWIQVTRGRQEKPWLSPAMLRKIRFLYYSSLFLCSAERYAKKLAVPGFLLRAYARTIKFRWQRKLFWLDWETPILRLIFRLFINPIDYKSNISRNYAGFAAGQQRQEEFIFARDPI